MIWNRHYALAGQHAYLSPSNNAWLGYDDDKFDRMFLMRAAAARGTELHDLASRLIRLGVKLEDTTATLNSYVNDCIGFRMETELVLFVSSNCYGTADAISFRNNVLRIFDLKTGVMLVSWKQLLIYAAMFCLEYRVNPFDIEIELRIYQNDAVKVINPDGDDVHHIMDRIKYLDQRAEELRWEVLNGDNV